MNTVQIAERIRAERRKHSSWSGDNWINIAAAKIYYEIYSTPTMPLGDNGNEGERTANSPQIIIIDGPPTRFGMSAMHTPIKQLVEEYTTNLLSCGCSQAEHDLMPRDSDEWRKHVAAIRKSQRLHG